MAVVRKVESPVIAPAVVPLPALTAQVVGTVVPWTAQPPRIDVPVLAIVVVAVVKALERFTAKPLPALRVMEPSETEVRPLVDPWTVSVPPPARVRPPKVTAVLLPVAAVRPVMIKEPDPIVKAVLAGKISVFGPVASERVSVIPPWLIVVEPV